MNSIEVIADYREMKSGIGDHLSTLPGVQLQWRNLPVGDYIIAGGAMFERKSASDFAASVLDQRLFCRRKD